MRTILLGLLLSALACETEPGRPGEADGQAIAPEPAPPDAAAPADAAVDAAPDAAPACALDPPPPDSSSPECRACIAASCCVEYNSLFASPEGQAYLECWLGCLIGGSPTCSADCDAEHPEGSAQFQAYGACLQAHCLDCGG